MNLNSRHASRLLVLSGFVLLLTFTGGWLARTQTSAQAGVRKSEPQPHFKSGAARSEAVLNEILATLRRMDERMARIEKNVARAAGEMRSAPGRLSRGQP